MCIDEQSKINLNGVPQFVSIRAEKENAPLLVYLHGGPVTIDVFLDDLHTLVKYLLSRFHQNSLYLIGHSWGSILGLRFVQAYPELVRAYIGCGQVVNMRKSSKIAYEYALEHADKKSLERLNGIDCSYQADSWLNDLLFVTRQVVKHKGSLYGRTNYNDLVFPFLLSRYYSLPDLIRRQKGSLQAIQCLWQEVMQTDFETQTQYGAPIIFIEGRYDYHVSSALVKEYFDRIGTEKQFYWFEKSCHFPQWSESERFNKLMYDLLAVPYL